MSKELDFQYCQKIVLFDDEKRVLLAQRKGEADYDGVYSFIGGKMETTDGELLQGVKREKEEEIGKRAIILVAPHLSYNVLFTKKDGSSMVLPHLYAEYIGGDIQLSDEYAGYKWVPIDKINEFEPKIETVPIAIDYALRIKQIVKKDDLFEI